MAPPRRVAKSSVWNGIAVGAYVQALIPGSVWQPREFSDDGGVNVNIHALASDFRHAVRVLRLNPGFATIALLSLALGIGANTAIFQLLDAVLLRMLPVQNPQSLIEVRVQSPKGGFSGSFVNGHAELTTKQWDALRERQQAFSSLFAWAPDMFNLSPGGEVRNGTGLWVSGNYFSALGIQPALGRLIGDADDHRGCGVPGAVISYAFWQREYHGDPTVIGRTITLNTNPAQIIGVAGAGFYGLVVGSSFDVALPICGAAAIYGERSPLDRDYVWWLSAMGRLKPGVSEAQALAQLNAIAPALFHDTLPGSFQGERAEQYLNYRLKLLPAGTGVSSLREDYSSPLWLLLGIAGLVLLIACANLANLMLARATAREKEFAVRLAMGASRWLIARQSLTESLLLAVIGAGLGVVVAHWLSRFLVSFLTTADNGLFIDLQPDWRLFAFATGGALLTCVLFGLAPAIRATRIAPQSAMKAGARGVAGVHERFGFRRGLVAAQIAMSLVLLVAALLLTRTLRNVMTVETGFRDTGVLVADLDFSTLHVPPANRLIYKQQLLDRVRALPGVDSAAEAAIVPVGGNSMNDEVWISGTERSKAKVSLFNYVSPDYFTTLGTSVLTGRDFKNTDTAAGPKVAIVNQEFARSLTGGTNPVGGSFRREATSLEPELDFQIVGMVANTKYISLRDDPRPIVYLPAAQQPRQGQDLQLVVHSNLPFSNLTANIRSLASDVSPRVAITFQSFPTMLRDSMLQERLMATLSAFFGALAIVLATVGLYGVISYMVIRRTNEIGIRMALGANRSGILSMILREAGLLLSAGVGVGIVMSLVGARAAKSLLYGLTPYDPLTLLAAIALIAVITIAASSFPAQRASKLNPMIALREE
jgi:putative ABC transport system permease protein